MPLSTPRPDFNPRSPYGERPGQQGVGGPQVDFNPRSPYGERQFERDLLLEVDEFQSTLPLRGATEDELVATVEIKISIHAPLTGSDRYMRDGAMDIFISIHAPLTGSDKGFKSGCLLLDDFNPRSPYGERPTGRKFRYSRPDFNPRSPYGERLMRITPKVTVKEFQSTLPLRGATYFPVLRLLWTGFQSTLPLRGATPPGSNVPVFTKNFNPRSPYGERPIAAIRVKVIPSISIHAPLTGSD